MKKLNLLVGCSLLIVGTAQAGGMGGSSNTGLYVGFGGGITNTNAKTDKLTNPNVCNTVSSNCSTDRKDKAWQVQAGYQFHPNVAVEMGYADLGRTADVQSKHLGPNLRAKQDTKAASLALVGKVPAGNMTGYGKVGVHRWESETHIEGLSAKNSAKEKGTDPVIGLGVEFKLDNHWTSQVGWDRYMKTGNNKVLLDSNGTHTLETNVDVYSVRLNYRF